MILSAQTIAWEVAARRLVIRPFHTRTVEYGMSYGLSCCGYDIRISELLVLRPGEFALATTLEFIGLPADLRGTMADKSTWARQGIAVQNTRFEPGWRGYPTLEISNHGPALVTIDAGAPIAQLEFARLDEPTTQPYTGKYQDQPQRPVEAIEEK